MTPDIYIIIGHNPYSKLKYNFAGQIEFFLTFFLHWLPEAVIDGEFDFRGATVPHVQSSQDIDK